MGVRNMKNNRTKLSQRVRYALLAGMAGAFLIPQVGFAAPTGEHDVTSGVTHRQYDQYWRHRSKQSYQMAGLLRGKRRDRRL